MSLSKFAREDFDQELRCGSSSNNVSGAAKNDMNKIVSFRKQVEYGPKKFIKP